MAFPVGWSHRIAITIDHTDIDADLTNWTLVFDQSFDSVLTQVNGPLDADGIRASINGGGDIRFSTDSAGANQLAVDIRDWTTNNTPGSATCEVAVGTFNVSSSADTTIYLWWGKSGETQPGAATTYGQYNAYDSDYELVYPLSENSGSRLDRTSNQETLTPNSSPTAVGGIVGNANSFDGLNDYLISGTSNPIEGGNTFTVECWSKAPRSQPNGYPDAAIVTLAAAGAASDALGFWCDAASPPTSGSGRSNLVAWFVAGERIESDNGQWTDDTWEHFAGTSSSTTLKLLIDGVEVTDSPKSVTIGSVRSNTRFLVAAWDFDLDRYERDGEIDELRISSTVRSNAWIAANYDNQRNKSGFLTWSTITDISGQDDLTGQDLTSGTPFIDEPTLGQVHDLDGQDLTSGTPVIDEPILGQTFALIPNDILIQNGGIGITVGNPELYEVNNFTILDLFSGTPVIDLPTLAEISNQDNLTGQDLFSGTPVIDSPILASTTDNLIGQDLISGTPVIEQPTIDQEHDFTVQDITTGIPTIGTPVVQSVAGLDNLTGQDITSGTPTIDSPALGQVHNFDIADILGGVTVDSPALGQVLELQIGDLFSGVPTIGTPIVQLIAGLDALFGRDLFAGAVLIDSPELGEIFNQEIVSVNVNICRTVSKTVQVIK
jgi:hypothetical protein